MIRSPPPFQVNQQLWGLLSGRPGAACERCHAMSDRQIDPFNEGGVQPSREAQSLQGVLESGPCPQAHHVCDAHELTPPVVFLYLPVDQLRCHLPLAYSPPSLDYFKPLAKMGREAHKSTH